MLDCPWFLTVIEVGEHQQFNTVTGVLRESPAGTQEQDDRNY
jgi:hypothetical protein